MKKIRKPLIAIFAINLIIYFLCILQYSCKKSSSENPFASSEIKNFTNELFKTQQKISKKPLKKIKQNSNLSIETNNSNLLQFYVNFGSSASPSLQTQFNQTHTVGGVADLISNSNGIVEYSPTNHKL